MIFPKPKVTRTTFISFISDTLFPEKKVATLWGISSMKELDARYAKRVRTATAELIVFAKSMIKFIREYSDAMAKIGTVANSSNPSGLNFDSAKTF